MLTITDIFSIIIIAITGLYGTWAMFTRTVLGPKHLKGMLIELFIFLVFSVVLTSNFLILMSAVLIFGSLMSYFLITTHRYLKGQATAHK